MLLSTVKTKVVEAAELDEGKMEKVGFLSGRDLSLCILIYQTLQDFLIFCHDAVSGK